MRGPSRPLRVAIDARFASRWGDGVAAVVRNLARALARLPDGDEQYLFLGEEQDLAWLAPHLHGPATGLPTWPEAAAREGFWARRWRRLRRRLRGRPPDPSGLPRSHGEIEAARADVVHFPRQSAFLTRVPSLYHPHDLQHVHLPEMFTADEIARRERSYPAFCAQAVRVLVANAWVRADLVRHLHLDPAKVAAVLLAPAEMTPASARDATVAAAHGVHEPFLLYPAQTWPHKNHAALFEALAVLERARGLRPRAVLTGRLNEHHPALVERARALGVLERVHFLGVVPEPDLHALYRTARAVVIPTRFEAGSLPLWEAFQAGTPAACSNVTSLPSVAGDAALLFDPREPQAIAEAIHRLWTDEALRAQLVARGTRRVAGLTWDRTARHFRAHYRDVAGGPLTEADRALLTGADA